MENPHHFTRLLPLVNDIDGTFVECGVYKGSSIGLYCNLAKQGLITKREIYGYDSFEGLPSPSKFDNNYKPGHCTWSRKGIDDLIGYYPDFVFNIVDGWFKDTLHTNPKVPIAILHLDVDVYQSYKECLENLYQYVQPGGLIIFDEYNSPNDLQKWPGAKIAIDEFFDPLGIEIQNDLESGKAYVLKP